MASATGRDGQAGGLGLRLELAQGPGGPQIRMHAGPAELAPGLRLTALVAEPIGAAPRSTAALREGHWRALEARLEVTAEALGLAAQSLRGVTIGGWPIGQVSVDLAGGSAVLSLAGPRDDGWPVLIQIELAIAAEAGEVRVRARRVWATGPLAPAGAAVWQAAARGLARGREGVVALVGDTLHVTPEWLLRRAFRAAGASPPRTRGLQVRRVRAEGRGLRLVLGPEDMSHGAGLKGHVLEDMSKGMDDPLAELRAALRAGDRAAALTALARAPAPTHPGGRRLTRALAQVRAELLRFHDRAGASAAVRAWLAAAPDDAEAWWRLVVSHARAGEAEGVVRGLTALERMPGPPAVRLRRRVARALVEAEQLDAGGRARAGLEEMAWSGSPAVQAEAWRALAIARAGDPQAAGEQVEAAVSAALAAAERSGAGWCAPEELHARVAAAGRRCGRDVAEAERAATELAELALARGAASRGLAEAIAARMRRVDGQRVRTELQTRAARSLDVGALLVLAKMAEETGEPMRAQGLLQVAAFLQPGLAIAAAPGTDASLRAVRSGDESTAREGSPAAPHSDTDESTRPAEVSAHAEASPTATGSAVESTRLAATRESGESWRGATEPRDDPNEPRAAILEALRGVAAETAGIRAPLQLAALAPEAAGPLLALAEAELTAWGAAIGMTLPIRAGRGGPEGGVTIRNEREPVIVVHPALLRLPARERRFRLALAAVLIRGGLALVLDPSGASLHELLDALAWLGEPSQVPTLPGAQTIVRLWHKRGVTPERFDPALRQALAQQLLRWRVDARAVARLATLLRGDHCVWAARLSGAFDGALLAIGRDARLPAAVDEAAARRVCATDEARRLLRGAGLIFDGGQDHD